MPASVIDGHVEAGELPLEVLENAREVLNILARLLNSASTPHLRLASTVVMPSVVPRDVQRLLTQPAHRRDFAITIDGYGGGRAAVAVR